MRDDDDAARSARLEAVAARATELAERGRQFTRKSITSVNPLCVRCPWCRANIGTRCTIPGTQIRLEEHPPMRQGFHPGRIEDAEKAKANA